MDHQLMYGCVRACVGWVGGATRGTNNDTRGTAFVVYEDIYDAKTACEHLSGFNVLGRYLIVLYYQPNKVTKKVSLAKKQEELNELKQKYGVTEADLKR
jgi:pre-mRNA branch site protein p14